MKRLLTRLPAATAVVATVLVALVGVALAQDGSGPTAFEGSNESMKYRHLWMGYAALWILIFGFVFRTWKVQQAARGELEDLRRRLDALEGADREGAA